MTSKNIANIEIRCPSCKKRGNMLIDEFNIINSERGISSINVSKDFICKHSFVVYVDRNLTIRDCFICDFKIQIPEIDFKRDKEEKDIIFDVDIVKINLIPTLLINTLKGIFLGKKIVIFFEDVFVGKNLLNFFNHITEGSFRLNLEIISRQNYKKNKKSYKDWIVLESSDIIFDKEKIINLKDLKIESIIARKFYSEFDSVSSLIIIKNEVNKAYRLIERMVDFVKDYEDEGELSSKIVLEYFRKEYNFEFDLIYLKFLMDILEIYFKVKPRKARETANFLDLL